MDKRADLNGLLILDKPQGPTSHDVVTQVRSWTRVRRVGHAGTLDPLATGVLVVCIGSATRLSEYLLGHPKRYVARVLLGVETDTYDADGTVLATQPVDLTRAEIEAALAKFRGQFLQRPPAFSAVKTGGERAYARARRGESVALPARPVEIAALRLVGWNAPQVQLEIECSAGTYVRSLAHDVGRELGCGAHLAALTRTACGPFTLAQAYDPVTLETAFHAGRGAEFLLPPDAGLADWPVVHLQPSAARRVMHGNAIPVDEHAAVGMARAYDSAGQLVAIVEATAEGHHWQPRKVLVQAS